MMLLIYPNKLINALAFTLTTPTSPSRSCRLGFVLGARDANSNEEKFNREAEGASLFPHQPAMGRDGAEGGERGGGITQRVRRNREKMSEPA